MRRPVNLQLLFKPVLLLPTSTYLHAALALVLCLSTFTVLGGGLHLLLLRKKCPASLFDYAVSGMLLIVSLFAIGVTGGQTILLPVPALLITGLLLSPRQAGLQQTDSLSRKLTMAAAPGSAAIFLVFFAQAFRSPDAGFIKYPSGDLAYYCRLARYLIAACSENRLADLPAQLQTSAQLYHWGDIWLIGLVARCTGLSEETALLLVVYPMLSALFSAGLYTLYQHRWASRKGILAALCVCAPLIGPAAFYLPAPWQYSYHFFAVPPAQYPKALFCGIVLISVLQRLRTGDLTGTILFTLIGGLAFASAMPALAFTAGVYFTRKLVQGKVTAKTGRLVTMMATATGLWIFYLYRWKTGAMPYLPSLQNIQSPGLYGAVLVKSLAHAAMLLPFLAIPAVFAWQERKPFRWLADRAGSIEKGLVLWLLMSLLSAVLCYTVSVDSFQLLSNALIVAAPILAVGCAGICFRPGSKWFAGAALTAYIVWSVGSNLYFSPETFLTDRISVADYRKLQAIIKKHPADSPLHCVSLYAPVNTNRHRIRNSVVFYPLEVLSLSRPDYTVASLNVPGLDDVDRASPNPTESLQMKWHTPVAQFAHRHHMDGASADSVIAVYLSIKHPVLLIAANDAVIPERIRGFLGADSLQLSSKRFRVFRLQYR